MRNKDHLKFKNLLDQKLKKGPENHILSLREQIVTDIKQQNEQNIKNWIKAIKMIIKDKIPTKPKFYALLLLKEMLATKDKIVVGYFASKLRQRLFLIANHKSKSHETLEQRGQDCLKRFYKNKNEEDKEYSIKFFILLWECWKEWDQMFAEKSKEIKNKTKLLKKNFPKEKLYYDYFEDRFGLEKDQFQTVDHYSMLYDTKSNFNTNQSRQNKKSPLLNEIFQKNIHDLQQEIEKLSHIFGNKSNAQRYNFQDFELINQNLKQSQNYFENNSIELEQFLKENQKQQIEKDFIFFQNTLLIFNKFKNQKMDENIFKEYMYQLYSKYYDDYIYNENERKFSTLQPIKEESKELEESKYNREASINTKRKSNYSLEWTKKDDLFSEFDKKPKDKQFRYEEIQKYDYSPQLTKSMKNKGNTPLKKQNFSQYSIKNDENFSQLSRHLTDKFTSQNDFDFQKTNRSKFLKQEVEIVEDQINFDDFQDFQTEQNFSSKEKTENDIFKKQNSEIKKKNIQELNDFDNFDGLKNFKRKSEQINRKQKAKIKNNFDDFDDFNGFNNQKSSINEKDDDQMNNDQKQKENLFDDFNDFENVDTLNKQDSFCENISNTKQSQYDENEERQQIDFNKDEQDLEQEKELNSNQKENKKNLNKDINLEEISQKKQSINENNDFDDFNDFDDIKFNDQKLQEQDSQTEFKSFKIDNLQSQEDSFMQTQPKNILKEQNQKQSINESNFQEQNIQFDNKKESLNKDKINDMFNFDNFQQKNLNNQQIQENINLEEKNDDFLNKEFNLDNDFNFPINDIQQNNELQISQQKATKIINSQRSSKKQSLKNDEVFKTINKLNQIQSEDEGYNESQQSKIQKIKINRNKESIYEIQSNNLEQLQQQNQNSNPQQQKEIQTLRKNYENLQNEYQKMLKNYATISQIDLDKFQFLLPKQKGLINQYFNQKIFERKNKFLLNQNRILKQLNEELVDSSQNLQAKRLSEAHVMKQLLINYNELVNNLKNEQRQLFEQAQLKDEENQILLKKFQKQSLYINKLKQHHQQIQKQVLILQNPVNQESIIENSQQNFINKSSSTNKRQAKLKKEYKQNDVSMHFEKLSKGSIEPIQPKLNETNLNNSIFQKMYKQLQVEKNNDVRVSQKTLDLNQENMDLEIHDISDNSFKDIIKDQSEFLKQPKKQKFSNYTLQNYPIYRIDKNNLLSLKASSLFNNSLLFKNDFIQISCLSQNFIHRSEKIVSLKLQYTPLQPDLKISTRIESFENIQSIPQFIINQYFESQLDQEFIFKTIGQFKNSTFQKLLLKITQGNNIEEISVPLPFTLNKFLEFDTIDSNQLDNFLAQAQYLKESTITIDSDIIPSFENLLQIFPSIIMLSETQFLLYIKFDYTKCMVLNMCQENDNRIKLDLLGKKMTQEFEWFYQWFTWIFTN